MKKLLSICGLLFALSPLFTSAHQPRLIEQNEITVVDPEVSKAYYGMFSGETTTFTIASTGEFTLYVNLLVPDLAGVNTWLTATVMSKTGLLTQLSGGEWKAFYEPFGGDHYLMGPEFSGRVASGTYTITLHSSSWTGPYIVAIGQIESFPLAEIWNTLFLVPQIKSLIFHKNIVQIMRSPIWAGWGVIIVVILLIARGVKKLIIKKK